MINCRVKDLTWLFDTLKKGIAVAVGLETYEYGKFGWIMNQEGKKQSYENRLTKQYG